MTRLRTEKYGSNVARCWCNKAAGKSPATGRLHHQLAILARPYLLEQLSLYTKSLTCITPSENARGSILTLFNPILGTGRRQPLSFETTSIRAHGILLRREPSDSLPQFEKALEDLDGLLDKYISKAISRVNEMGVSVAVSNIAALFEYGTQNQGKCRLRLAYKNAQKVKGKPTESNFDDSGNLPSSTGPPDSKVDDIDLSEFEAAATSISYPSRLASTILAIFLKRTQDKNIYPLLHVYLTFIWSLILVQQAWSPVENEAVWKIIDKDMPWITICTFLNTLLVEPKDMPQKDLAEDFP
jgi:hypothetical protein